MKTNLTQKWVLLWGLFLFTAICSTASPTINLTSNTEDIALGANNYDFFEDSTGNLSFNSVLLNQKHFRLNKEDYRFNKNETSAYWIRFKVLNKAGKDQRWILEGMSQQTCMVEVFSPNENGIYVSQKTGTDFNFFHRKYQTKNFIFNLPTYREEPFWVYIKVKSTNHSGFIFHIRSFEHFTFINTTEYYLAGMYYGILLIMAIYNLLLFISIRIKTYLLYVAFVLSCIMVSASEDGLGFQYLWSMHPTWNIPIDYYVAPIILLISFWAYSVSFLELRNKYPKAFKLQTVITVSYLVYFILQVSFSSFVPYIPGVYAIPFISVYLISIYIWKKGYLPARYYTIGFSFVVISIIVNQLRNSDLLGSISFVVFSFNFGILFEVVIFSFALGDRFRILKSEKEKAQSDTIGELKQKESYKNILIHELKEKEELKDKVNRELEQKVSERTKDLQGKSQELEESNAKLQLAINELNKMNVQLDLNNWGLQKKVSEETKLRILSEEVSYEEFLKIFPNDPACLRYLEEIKWGQSYQCKKCGHDKYNQPKPFTRKCTKCWHIESVTAVTLFHGTKFPLTKAFYIVYLTLNNKNKITIEELSEMLDLRRNTCWSFKKKVTERVEELQKKKGKPVTKWESLFLDQI